MKVEVLSNKGRFRHESGTEEEEQQNLFHLSTEKSTNTKLNNTIRTTTEGSCSLLRMLVLLVLVTCVVSVFFVVDKDMIVEMANAFKQNRTGSGMALFFLTTIIAIACFIPGPILAGLSGALYGKFTGVAVFWGASTVSQCLTYVLGRYLFRDVLVSFISKRYKFFSTIDNVIAQQGWKLVVLLRLTPVLPDSVLNYILATTSVAFVPYILASAAAVLPWTIIFTYLGSVASDVATATSGEITMSTGWFISISLFSVGLCGLFFYLIASSAKKALAEVIDEKNLEKSSV